MKNDDAESQKKPAPEPSVADRGTKPEPPKRSFAAAQAPALELPKGGGAIRGMGETFQVNPATGTSAISIPLPLSPSPRGPSPALTLSYDSGSGNGPFGLGWSMSLPEVTRKTDKKLPEYADSQDSDVFLLSGAEDLVPTLLESGARDTVTTSTEIVERYRPRIEGLFSRIERVTTIATGEVHFRAITRDNVKSTFGDTAASRLADPSDEKRVFSWLLSKTEDDRGNVVTYEHKAEDLAGVPAGRSSEHHRKTGLAPITNRYLKRVRYGNTTMGDPSSARFELVLDYAEHDLEAPAPDDAGVWALRQDPFSSYRPGFEVRTYRLCKRVLMFHRFPELGSEPCLVRALELTHAESPRITTLVSAQLRGYTRTTGGTYESLADPPVTFGYSPDTLSKQVKELTTDDLGADFPKATINRTAQWVDLDGEGLPGVIIDMRDAPRYKRNRGDAKLLGATALEPAPSVARGRSTQLMDIAGAGTMSVVAWGKGQAGYQERKGQGWGSFIPFPSMPTLDLDDPNVRFVDLNGDGFEDILVTKGDAIEWYPSKGRGGFGPAKRVSLPSERKEGPRVVFADPLFSIMLADMSGDGLSDIVRITHRGISYWPNLGYGRFGAEVQMDSAPYLDHREAFDARRVRLADLDGTGPADLLHFRHDGLHVYRNQSGNGWTEDAHFLGVPVAALPSISIVDLFGTGTSCVLWCPQTDNREPVARYIDPLESKKPHLLEQIDNGLGKLVRLAYTTSTKLYLDDLKAGRPWLTKLPFPVQVVERTESYDAISRTRLISTYRYSHGHYDTQEREFRGFGYVERVDAERFGAEHGKGLFPEYPAPINGEIPQPPVLTKTWLHTGAFPPVRYDSEYWNGDSAAPAHLECTTPTGLPAIELREAARALKGVTLREEVFALDGSPDQAKPFAVTERAYAVRRLQPRQKPRGENRQDLSGVFHVVDAETRAFAYERIADDPRVTQTLPLAIDAYGVVTRSASLAYPRRTPPAGLPEQAALHAVVTESDVLHLDNEPNGRRLSIPVEARTWDLTGLTGAFLTRAAVQSAFESATEIPYRQSASTGIEKRLVQREKVQYCDPTDLATPLPFGQASLLAFPFESYLLDLTQDLVDAVFDTRVDSTILSQAGYVTPEGETGYWLPSGQARFRQDKFYLPETILDPFGAATHIAYDPHAMFATTLTDPLGNVVSATHDYRVLSPALLTDPNGNRQTAAFDPQGRVIKTAVMGKTTETLGDTLESPTARFEYETHRFRDEAKPNYVHTYARETHADPATRWQETYVYSDGSGRVAMVKAQAEPDPITSTPRWLGTGRTVLNNKGNPVKQYEPYFSATPEYEDEADIVETGVTPILTYDALGRLERTDLPNGSYSRAEWTPWLTKAYDPNDTVLEPANRWYADRLPSATPTPSAQEQRARALTEAHADTPTTTHFDSLGRPFLVVADNGPEGLHETRTKLDIEGQPLQVKDALGRTCQTTVYSLAGQIIQTHNIDTGTRRRLSNALGQTDRVFQPLTTSTEQVLRSEYDALRRPTNLWADSLLLHKTVYGESAPTPELNNLRARPIRQFDGAGLTRALEFDFKGNPLQTQRQLATVYDATVDWTSLATLTNLSALETAAAASLEPEPFTETRQYDALNRITSVVSPDTSQFVPSYNEAGLLESVQVHIRGAATPTPFVTNIDYNEKGQRTAIGYGNGTATAYQYDPLTFRLTRLTTSRTTPSATLQDLAYTLDPVGNIVQIVDTAQQAVFFNNAVVLPENRYVYDAIYRLLEANGREHHSLGDVQFDDTDCPIETLPHANNATALRNYAETYLYDKVGNILELFHDAEGTPHATWRRRYDYGPFDAGVARTNHLRSTSLPGDTPGAVPYSAQYTHDVRGNMTSMPHLSAGIDWNALDQMVHASNGTQDTYFVYAADGTRVRKVFDTNTNLIKERIYLGSFELYRERVSGTIQEERQTLHIMDGLKRLAMVETKTVDAGSPVAPLLPMQRYQLGNHLGSAMLELDETGLVISYEEYHPYGSSAYRSARSGVEVSARRYRYVGMERDDETGLYLMGARYYAGWLGRWTSADPMGIGADGPGLYNYTRGSPVTLSDPSGHEGKKPFNAAEFAEQPLGTIGRGQPDYILESRVAVAKQTPSVQAVSAPSDRTAVATTSGPKNTVAPGFERGHADPPPERESVLSGEAVVQGAKDRVKQKFWAGLEELPGAIGTVFAAVHLYVNPQEKVAELSRPAEAPALDPLSQVIGAVKSGISLANADKETRSKAVGGFAVDLLQQIGAALILGAAIGKGATGGPKDGAGPPAAGTGPAAETIDLFHGHKEPLIGGKFDLDVATSLKQSGTPTPGIYLTDDLMRAGTQYAGPNGQITRTTVPRTFAESIRQPSPIRGPGGKVQNEYLAQKPEQVTQLNNPSLQTATWRDAIRNWFKR